MLQFQAVVGAGKPVVAMAHLGASPGAPLYDAARGVGGIVGAARADPAALQAAGGDSVMFGNENDRPCKPRVDFASSATIANVIACLRRDIHVPFGGNMLWDPMASLVPSSARSRMTG